MKRFIWILAIIVFVSISCTEKEPVDGTTLPPLNPSAPYPVSVELYTENALDVTFAGQSEVACHKFGVFLYTCDGSHHVSKEEIVLFDGNGETDSQGRYIKVVRITPDSEYEYVPFIDINGTVTEGETLRFSSGYPLSFTFSECGLGYVAINCTVPFPTEMAYLCSSGQLTFTDASEIFDSGRRKKIMQDGELYLIADLEENARYHLYVAAKTGTTEMSEIFHFEFETGVFPSDEMLSLISTSYDGYEMYLNVPGSVKATESETTGSRAIRYAQADLLCYNYVRRVYDNDEYKLLLYNANRSARVNTPLVYSEDTRMYQSEEDADGDGENDWESGFNPIYPGEPVVFIAGEFEWMVNSGTAINGFYHPPFEGIDAGYYYPCLDAEKYHSGTAAAECWTGAFQKLEFRVKEPSVLDAEIDVYAEDMMSDNATISIIPSDGVKSFVYMVLAEGTYQALRKLLDYHDEYIQWAVTSYYAAYILNPVTSEKAVTFPLAEHFEHIPASTDFHILVVGFGDETRQSQCFVHKVLSNYQTEQS